MAHGLADRLVAASGRNRSLVQSPYGYDLQVAINSQGLRNVARTGYDKQRDTFRILLPGDSYVEGLRASLEQTLCKTLGTTLDTKAYDALKIGATSPASISKILVAVRVDTIAGQILGLGLCGRTGAAAAPRSTQADRVAS